MTTTVKDSVMGAFDFTGGAQMNYARSTSLSEMLRENGDSLFGDANEKRRKEYRAKDIASKSAMGLQKLEMIQDDIQAESDPSISTTTGHRRSLQARKVAEQFSPMAGQEFRLAIPLRA